jgi:hypothetical protein
LQSILTTLATGHIEDSMGENFAVRLGVLYKVGNQALKENLKARKVETSLRLRTCQLAICH